MSEATADKALDMVRQLAEKLGTTADKLWPAMVASEKMNAVLCTAFSGALAVIAIVVGVLCLVRILRREDDGDDYAGTMIILVGSIVVAVVCLILLPYSIPAIIYPEPSALRDLAAAFK